MSAAARITIIGGGWSVRNVNLEKLPGLVIAVNDSALHAPRWDIALSMDRLWTENRLEPVLARPALPDPITGKFMAKQIWLRRSAVQNIRQDILDAYGLKVFDCDHTTNVFTETEGRLNGTNSGACALNLAFQLKPRRLFLLGFDMNRSPAGDAYWYPPYPWTDRAGATSSGKYARWATQFEVASCEFQGIGCEVFNVSPASAIPSFRKITPRDLEKLA